MSKASSELWTARLISSIHAVSRFLWKCICDDCSVFMIERDPNFIWIFCVRVVVLVEAPRKSITFTCCLFCSIFVYSNERDSPRHFPNKWIHWMDGKNYDEQEEEEEKVFDHVVQVLTKQAFTDFHTFRAMTCIFADFNYKTNNGVSNLHQLNCRCIRSIVVGLSVVCFYFNFAHELNSNDKYRISYPISVVVFVVHSLVDRFSSWHSTPISNIVVCVYVCRAPINFLFNFYHNNFFIRFLSIQLSLFYFYFLFCLVITFFLFCLQFALSHHFNSQTFKSVFGFVLDFDFVDVVVVVVVVAAATVSASCWQIMAFFLDFDRI